MKLAAYILLASFLSYFSETIKIPVSFSSNCKKNISCPKMMKEHCTNEPGNKSSKPAPQACNSSCVNCPFNAVTIFEPYKVLFKAYLRFEKVYPFPQNFVLSDFHSVMWKPPNNLLV